MPRVRTTKKVDSRNSTLRSVGSLREVEQYLRIRGDSPSLPCSLNGKPYASEQPPANAAASRRRRTMSAAQRKAKQERMKKHSCENVLQRMAPPQRPGRRAA